MRNIMKIKPSRNDEITLSFTDGLSREILKSQICAIHENELLKIFRIYST